MENKYEIRSVTELRANPEAGLIQGTAINFGVESRDLGGFKEIIETNPEEVRQLLDSCDIFMLFNHSDSNVLARSKNGTGTLTYTVDERGVHFSFRAKKKDQGLVESIAAGDLDGCSFAFRLPSEKSAQSWEKRSDGTYLRRIKKFAEIRDFSIVTTPAYLSTEVTVRQLEQVKAEEIEARKAEAESAVKADEKFNHYYQTQLKKYLS